MCADESRRLLHDAAQALLELAPPGRRPFVPALIGLVERVARDESTRDGAVNGRQSETSRLVGNAR